MNYKVILTGHGCDVHTIYEVIESCYTKGKIETVRLWLMDESVNLNKQEVESLINDLQSWLKKFSVDIMENK